MVQVVEESKLVSFKIGPTLQKRLKEQALKEQKTMSRIVEELLIDYLKAHEDGNPNFKLTQWSENSEFMAEPATARSKEFWDKYLSNQSVSELASYQARFLQLYNLSVAKWRAAMRARK